MWYDFLGYAASILIAVSMLMVSIVRLRVINLVGGLCFIAYGIFLPSVPIILANLLIAAANIYHLNRALRAGRQYCDYVPMGQERHGQLDEYLEYQLARIIRIYPFFDLSMISMVESGGGEIYMAMHQTKPRGLAIWVPLDRVEPRAMGNYAGLQGALGDARKRWEGQKVALLLVDYIDSKYRDLNLYVKLYSQLNRLQAQGYQKIVTLCSHDLHRTRGYLKARGFAFVGEYSGLDLMELTLPFM